ncbi:MAG: phosphatidylglycerol lysyltransferase domain-containing protein [Desulfobulbaceae bacterium]|nr:phosphatidylglycerol lysyltransferase domain-containing protein [Desulfobulbaceae bacterium]
MRSFLHPFFQELEEGISEFTFANLYLFRKDHHYRITRLHDESIIITGSDAGSPFFMSPFGLPPENMMDTLLRRFGSMKCLSGSQADYLRRQGLRVEEDRNNFDYLYFRKDLAALTGRKFSRKRNQIKAFISTYSYEGRPLLEKYKEDAILILEKWREGHDNPGDYAAAREALKYMEELQLCGGIYYAAGRPVAYSLGEELMRGRSFVIHFEKAVSGYKGLWQFVNQAFALILPDKYTYINREQDLGSDGLRSAKLSYQPFDFIKKYRAWLPS